MVTITKRSEALRNGDTIYFTGKQCKAGHFAGRYASTGNCITCVKNAVRKPQYKMIRVHVDDIEIVEAINTARRLISC
jgi:hypothetical protein